MTNHTSIPSDTQSLLTLSKVIRRVEADIKDRWSVCGCGSSWVDWYNESCSRLQTADDTIWASIVTLDSKSHSPNPW